MNKKNQLILSDSDEWLLPEESSEELDLSGWRFSFSLECKNGAKASAKAFSSDESQEGRREVRCIVFDKIYEQMVRQNGCMIKNSVCDYTVTEWKKYSYSGPSLIKGPREKDSIVVVVNNE